MEEVIGRVGSAETGSREPSRSVSALTGFDPARSEQTAPFLALADECESAKCNDQHELLSSAYRLVFGGPECIPINTWPGYKSPRWDSFHAKISAGAFLDAARMLLAPHTLWASGSMEDGPFARLCWPMPDGTYLGGFVEGQAENAALSMCAAAMRGHAIATEARRAETPKSGSVHEGAGPQDIAQKETP